MSDDTSATPAPRAPGVTVRETVSPAAAEAEPAPSPESSELDGDELDYRYIQVRRAIIYIEQSIKAALQPFVFEQNTQATWSQVVSAASGVLREIWSRGRLAGATPEEAFGVQCGLGSTMTAQDVRDGNVVVDVILHGLQPTPTALRVVVKLHGGA